MWTNLHATFVAKILWLVHSLFNIKILIVLMPIFLRSLIMITKQTALSPILVPRMLSVVFDTHATDILILDISNCCKLY